MRDHRTRALAERALARLVSHVDGHTDAFVVVGGLNPEHLAPVHDAPHQGTADIDLVIEIGVVYDRDELDLGWLERALEAADFEPTGDARAWQWVTSIEGTPVRIDLLVDVLDHVGQQIAVPGCDRMTVMNVAGPGAALHSRIVRSLPLTDAGSPTVEAPFADLGGYLLAKSAAVLGRRQDKDPYDLAFVLLHNTAGGPTEGARAALAALPATRGSEYLGAFRAALVQLRDPSGRPAQLYAAQRLLDGADLPHDVLAADAAAAAALALTVLDAQG
jgi:hypothetical protein